MAFRPQAQWPARLAWAGFVLVLAVPLWWGIHASFSWDVDNIAPGSVLKAMAARFAPGWHSSYGPVPYLLTAAIYAPILALMRLAGELGRPVAAYPWGFTHPDAAVAILVVAARLLNLGLALGVAALAAHEAAVAGPARVDRASRARPWLVPLMLAGSTVFVYYARTSNVDMAALFWAWLAFVLAETPRGPLARYAAAAAAAALAVCSKEQIAPFALVAGSAACAGAWRLRARAGARGAAAATGRVRGASAVGLVVAAGLLTYALAWGLPFNASGWLAHHRFLFETARYPRTFAATAGGYAALGLRVLRLAPLAFGLPALLGLLAVLATRPGLRGLGLRALASALYLAAFVAPVGYVYPRFLLPLLLLVLPLAVRGLDAAWQRAASPLRAVLAGGTVLLALAGGPVLDAVMLADTRLAVERWLAAGTPPGARVEVAGNPHFQARVPRTLTLLVTSPDSLRAKPRGPRGDVVLLSSFDAGDFRRPPLRGAWADSLGPGGPYRRERVFTPPALARRIEGLPVAPEVEVYVRERVPSR